MNLAVREPSVRIRLRQATEDVHQPLHHAAPFAAIADGSITLEAYGRLLRMLYRFHGAMMPLCAAGAEILCVRPLAGAQTRRVAALAADLADLDLLPPPLVREPLRDGVFNAGVIYTVLGSTLGGKVIFSQLDALLNDVRGRRFFRGTPEDGRDWQQLCAALELQENIAAMESGARHAFARFAQILNDTP